MYTAFPYSDYYESSALDVVRLRSSRLAQFRTGQTYRVPVFPSSTFTPLGGMLYPWRYGERAMEAHPVPSTLDVPSSRENRALPH